MEGIETAGAIYDIGYRHYDGPRLGRRAAIRALYVQGLKSVFGIGRGWKAKVPPIAIVSFMSIPALIQSGLEGLTGQSLQLFTHGGYLRTAAQLFALLCAAQAPELVSGDQRNRVLALYFSRAIHRSDYVFARVAALASALFAVALLPHLILLFGHMFAATDVLVAMRESLPLIGPILGGSIAVAVLLSIVSLAISAVIQRRPFATATIVGVFLITSGIFGTLVQRNPEKLRYFALASPLVVSEGLTTWLFDTSSTGADAEAFNGTRLTSPSDVGAMDPQAAAAIAAIAAEQQGGRRGAQPPPATPGARGVQPGAGREGGPAARRRRPPRIRRSTIQAARHPGYVYLVGALGYVLLASGTLALRYRGIDT